MTDYIQNAMDAILPSGSKQKFDDIISRTGHTGLGRWLQDLVFFSKWFFNLVISAVVMIPTLLNGVVTFFTALYVMLPTALNGLQNWISRFNSTISDLLGHNVVDNTLNSASGDISTIVNYSSEGSSIWSWVLYCLNADVFISTIQALASLLFIWIQVCIAICAVVTALIASGIVVYGTRKVVKYISAGIVDV